MVSVKQNDSTTQQSTGAEFVHDDPIADQALEWFVRLQVSEADAPVREDLQRWLLQDPRHEYEFRALEGIWGAEAFGQAVAGLKPVMVKHAPPMARRARTWTMRGTAAAACLVLATGLWQGPELLVAWQADYATATGSQSAVSLPDGSSMLLNTDTAVSIDFENGQRRVRLLKGEAFFDVKHDQARPFHVAGDYGDVEVKGTAFSVRTDGEETTVILERGLVDVTCLCTSGGEAQLLPGQMVTASAAALSQVSSLDPDRALAWRTGRIAFDGVRLGKVVAELSRYYRSRVFIASTRVEQMVVSGNYRLDNIEGAIRTLADAAGVGMTRLPGGVIILR